MKKIVAILTLAIIFMLSEVSTITAEQGMIGRTSLAVEPAMTRGPENAPIHIYEFSSYQ